MSWQSREQTPQLRHAVVADRAELPQLGLRPRQVRFRRRFQPGEMQDVLSGLQGERTMPVVG